MIKTEYLNEGTLIKHYSDSGFMLLQNETGEKYADPIDVVPCPYTYTETDELIQIDDESTEEDNKSNNIDEEIINDENIIDE